MVDLNASVDNPGGVIPEGSGLDNTRTEQAPMNQSPAVDVKADIPGPTTYDAVGSGGLFVPAQQLAAPANEATAPKDALLKNQVETAVGPIPSIPGGVPFDNSPPSNLPTVEVRPGISDGPPELGSPLRGPRRSVHGE